MVAAMMALALGLEKNPPPPPYRRMATVPVFGMSYQPPYVTSGNRFYSAWGDVIVAFDLPSMKQAWSVKFKGSDRPSDIALRDEVLYLTTERAPKTRLIAMSTKTGEVLWSIPRVGQGSAMSIDHGMLFLSMKPGTLSALDLKTRRTKWTANLDTPQKDSSGLRELDAVQAADGHIVANHDETTYGFDEKTGKRIWRVTHSYVFRRTLAVSGRVAWIPSEAGSVGVDVRSGKVLWHSVALSDCYTSVAKGRFIALSFSQAVCVDPRTGKTLWSRRIGDPNVMGSGPCGAILGDLVYAYGSNRGGVYEATGKEIWDGSADDALSGPCWSDGRSIVCFDGLRLIRYEHGQEATLPTDPAGRRALAKRLVDHFADLDDADKKRLKSLGDDAFEPLLAAFIATCHAYDAAGEHANSFPLYSRYHDMAEILTPIVKKSHTQEMIDALIKEKPNGSAKPTVLGWLEVGDPKVVTPYFIKELEGAKTPGFEMYESTTYVARTYVAGSSDPRAVAFMLKQLRDPKADSELRFEAYENLAGTGGEEGLKAVLAERNRRQLLRPVGERAMEGYLNAGEFGTRTKPLGERDDAQGRHWGLLQSGVLGSSGDLWLAEKIDGHWTHALFTGVTLGGSTRRRSDANKPPAKIDGKTAEELAKGAWFSALVGNAELSKDADGDGLTDIEEKRLGTYPAKADTDGDGDPDGVDPWPNAPNRTDLSDAEQVLAAAFEARYHFNDSEGAGIFTALPGMKPFEMPGRRGTMMWVASGATSPMSDLWEQGVAFISFQPQDRDESKPWEQRLIQWNSGHTEAKVLISTYFGGLNGTGYNVVVRKFGKDWVAVSMRMAYVS